MEENERRTIRFLRALIQTDEREEQMPNGVVDAGWCCMEHAWVSSMMFCCLGIRVLLCEGMAIIGNKAFQLPVQPHFFTLIEDQPKGIFDSSFEYKSIKGIPRTPSPLHSHLLVAFFTAKPTPSDFKNELKNSKRPLLLLYAAKHKLPPDEAILNRESRTPFGKWLTSKFGSQKGLFAKAAFCAAEVHAGRLHFDASWGRDRLWEEVASIPDKMDFVSECLLKSR
ncbi:MAG: hypothetical protein B7Z37_22275 [Verrucomicrobia bacterium 12-59-8]|nr:MAG: hypothetical protein B7Z37_22275 [Verrucomicrobia bacterium 12-59-8]